MPGFHHGGSRNIRGDALKTPKEQLFELVLDMLAYEGYKSLTFDEIGRRGGDAKASAGYGTKEDLCLAVLKDAAERMELLYAGITEEARRYLETSRYTKEESWKQLERLLYRHIYQCFHPKNRIYVLTALQESQLPPGLQKILPDTLWRCFGSVLAQMIYAVSQVKNEQIAAMSACAICGSINVFVQQPVYCKNVFMGQTGKEPNYALVEDLLNDHFLRAIAADTAINKAF